MSQTCTIAFLSSAIFYDSYGNNMANDRCRDSFFSSQNQKIMIKEKLISVIFPVPKYSKYILNTYPSMPISLNWVYLRKLIYYSQSSSSQSQLLHLLANGSKKQKCTESKSSKHDGIFLLSYQTCITLIMLISLSPINSQLDFLNH